MAWRTTAAGSIDAAVPAAVRPARGGSLFASRWPRALRPPRAAALASVLPTMRSWPEEEHGDGPAGRASPPAILRLVRGGRLRRSSRSCCSPLLTAVDVDRLYGVGMTPVLVVASGAAIALAGVFFRPWAQPLEDRLVRLRTRGVHDDLSGRRRGHQLDRRDGRRLPQRVAGSGGAARLERRKRRRSRAGRRHLARHRRRHERRRVDRRARARWRACRSPPATSRSVLSWSSCSPRSVFVLAVALLRRRGTWRAGRRRGMRRRPSTSRSRREACCRRLPPSCCRASTPSGGSHRACIWSNRRSRGSRRRWRSRSSSASSGRYGRTAPTPHCGASRRRTEQQFVVDAISVGMLVLAALATAVVALLAVGATAGTGTRPLGIVWDIACFLPQTGHPFGPPCYAERAVPEIAGRINHWLRTEDRRVVLAAHSMGAVLAMSTIGLLASSDAHPPTAAEGRGADLRRAASPLLRPDAARAARPRGAGHGPARIAAGAAVGGSVEGGLRRHIARIDQAAGDGAARSSGSVASAVRSRPPGRPAEPTRCDG